jgi:flagellar basal-body rod modification protein FlgD
MSKYKVVNDVTNQINSALLLSNYQQTQNKTASNNLGKDAFLKLLMTQLQNQDPSNPVEDTEFIAQMAQFSTLEQITNLNSTMERFIQLQEQNQLISYHQFIGNEINWRKVNELENGESEVIEGSGIIQSVQFNNKDILFILEDGTELYPANISKINETSPESSLLQASMMIGKTVSYLNDQDEEKTANVSSVSFKNGVTTYHLDIGDTSITAKDIIKIA